jgi:hypothetical protein
MNVTIPALNFTSKNPAKVVRTIAVVEQLRADGVTIKAPGRRTAGQLRQYAAAFLGFTGAAYWTLAARLLAS